jgi:signal transduction histidine kinase/ActR/RegA family two-component response regulator
MGLGELDELEFLSSAALALSELAPEEDVFRFVTERLVQLAPNTLIMTTSYDAPTGTASLRAVSGPEDMRRLAAAIAGEPNVLEVDAQARQLLAEGRLVRLEEGMHQLTFRTWPIELARRFEEKLGIKSVHGLAFSRLGDFLGGVAFVSRASSLEHARLIEAFVRLAAVAIQRRRAEARLRESEQRFRMLAENSRDVVFRLRLKPKPRFEYMSPAIERLLGFTPDELYADARLGVPGLCPEEWLSGGCARGLVSETVEAHCQHRDGTWVWTERNFTPIRDANGDVLVVEGIARDITKRKEQERAMIEGDRRKTEFIAMLSHELRNPLGAIHNGVYVLGRAQPGSEQARRALAAIERQVTQLTRLIDDLLDVTRITRGKVRLQKERVEMNDLVRSTVDDYRPMFEVNRIDIEVLAAPADVVVFGDRARIRQIVDNLLHNAAKFTPPGGRTSVSVRSDVATGEAEVRVHNTGAPIPKELLANVFEPFVQAERTLDRSKGGLGLGLALVKGLVEMHGGSAKVDSDEHEGTEFTVRLPLDTSVPEPVLAHPRVLVIEDNVDAAETLRAVLEVQGDDVAVASNGREGIEVARSFHPDVVLCDIGLPEMDGYEVARAIRADPALRSLRLVALTGYATPDDVAAAREAGFDRHMAKPPDVDMLERLVNDLARVRDPSRGLANAREG